MKETGRWIRKDREKYLFGGVIVTCMIASAVSSYWHFSDRLQIKKSIKIKSGAAGETVKRLHDTQLAAPKMKVGKTRYYKLEPKTSNIPVPKPGEDDEN